MSTADLAKQAGMSEAQWKEAIKFDSTDRGWIIMSIGMAIGAGIVFLPVQVGLVGVWVFLLSALIAYPSIYLLQRLFINTLADSPDCNDYPSIIGGYLGKNWGFFLGILYFMMSLICVFMYSTALTNDSASFLQSFGVTKGLLCVVACLGLLMVQSWDLANLGAFPDWSYILKQTIIMLPYTLTSIIFIPCLSPMVISYRSHHTSIHVARYKAMRAMKIAFFVLFITVFSYAMSFNLAMGHEQAVEAYTNNISALAMVARGADADAVKIFSLILNIFAVVTAYFSVFLGFKEACTGIALNILSRLLPAEKINKELVSKGILVFAVSVSWGAIVLNAPILKLLSFLGPILGCIGCLIPAYLVYKVGSLRKYKGMVLNLIVFSGVLLVVSPFIAMI